MTRSSAKLSDCGTYRYWLERRWGDTAPMVFVMLNPSTADATEDDPTIRRCRSFAEREGAGGLIVVNLFALRATNPAELQKHDEPVGPDNVQNVGQALLLAAITRGYVVCAWGAHDMATREARRLRRRASDCCVELRCLGLTKAGAPRHPLYLKSDAPLVPYSSGAIQ